MSDLQMCHRQVHGDGEETIKSHEMGAALDGASRSCVLFRTASVFMQKRVQRTLQVSEGGTDMYTVPRCVSVEAGVDKTQALKVSDLHNHRTHQ